MTVGLAGKACAGKDALVPFFTDRGFSVVDAEKIGHQALGATAPAVLARFGPAPVFPTKEDTHEREKQQ